MGSGTEVGRFEGCGTQILTVDEHRRARDITYHPEHGWERGDGNLDLPNFSEVKRIVEDFAHCPRVDGLLQETGDGYEAMARLKLLSEDDLAALSPARVAHAQGAGDDG